MSPTPDRSELDAVLELVVDQARAYLASIDDRPVRMPTAERAADALGDGPLPDRGAGATAALRALLDASDGLVGSTGPRCFHFVIGGVTPAALGADWLATAFDQIAYAWVTSPLATRLEQTSLRWLLELFGLPTSHGAVMTTGATMANFVGLAAARQWWGERHGVDCSEAGLAGLGGVPVLTSGHVHASSLKCLGLLGIGRQTLRRCAADGTGRLDLGQLRAELDALGGAPAILIANAGEVNAGAFDPVEAYADLAEEYGCWLHVDGAFGLFAQLAPECAHLTAGVERADSVTVDGHKWLNVPYDCGFAFVRDRELMARAFVYDAAYLPDPDDPRPNFGAVGPESSRRARSFAVWATLAAYGKQGYRELVERHLALARHLAKHVDAAPELQRLAEVEFNIVCFRYDPGGKSEAELDALNDALGAAILADGRVYAGTTKYDGRTALRPALVNWRTRESDVELFVAVVRELAAGLTSA